MATVTKRRWKKPDGSIGETWLVRYSDPSTGTRPGKSFPFKKDADAFRRKVEREIEDGVHVTRANAQTIAQVADLYLASVKQRVADGRLGRSRLRDLENAFDHHILPHVGGKRLADLVPADAESLYRAIIADGKRGPMSARHAVQELGTLEAFALRQGSTKTTPIAIGLRDLRGIKSAPIRTLTQDEAATVLRHALAPRRAIRRRAAALLACAVHLAGCCGLRSGEIRALTRGCLDLDGGEIRVRRGFSDYMEVKGPKTVAGNRNVPIPAHLVAMLREWIATWAHDRADDLLFTTIGGKPIKGPTLRAMWGNLCEEAGIERGGEVHFHALRHFAASWWIENGISLPETATMLGHSKVDMTLNVYAHALTRPAARAETFNRMAARLTAPESTPSAHG